MGSAAVSALPFEEVNDTCSGLTLASNASCTMTVVFHPLAANA